MRIVSAEVMQPEHARQSVNEISTGLGSPDTFGSFVSTSFGLTHACFQW